MIIKAPSVFLYCAERHSGLFTYFISFSIINLFFIFLGLFFQFWEHGTFFWRDLLDLVPSFMFISLIFSFILVLVFREQSIFVNLYDLNIKKWHGKNHHILDKLKLRDEYSIIDLVSRLPKYKYFNGCFARGKVKEFRHVNVNLDKHQKYDVIFRRSNLNKYKIKFDDLELLINIDNNTFIANKIIDFYYYDGLILYADLGGFIFVDSRLILDFLKFKKNILEYLKQGFLVYAFLAIFSIPFVWSLDVDLHIFHQGMLFIFFVLILIFSGLTQLRYLDIKKLKLIKKLLNESWLKVISRLWNLDKTCVSADNGENSICVFYKQLG